MTARPMPVPAPVAVPPIGAALPEPPPGLTDALAGPVAAALPAVAAHIPDGPAAVLGRLGAPAARTPGTHGVDAFLAERLLGALELTVADLVLDVTALAAHVPAPPTGPMAVGSILGGGEVTAAVQVLGQVAAGVRDLVDGLVGALAVHPGMAPLLAVGPGTEPEPPAVARPEAAYRWVRGSGLGMAATVTVVTGASAEEVLDAFGADPAEPVPMSELFDQRGIDPWVTVLPVDGAVLTIEYNGWQGAQAPVLRPASARGRAASMYWNVNALTTMSFAREGAVLASFEPPPPEPPDDADVRAALDRLDLDDHRDRVEKGLVAVERFTGRGLRPGDVERIEAAGVAYRILPRLPELYPVERLADGSRRRRSPAPLGPDTEILVGRPEAELRDLAWWVAAEVAARTGLDAREEVAASLARRALTPDAEVQARATGLEGRHQHRQVWLALHEATNLDPLAAAINALECARYALGPHAADVLDLARDRIDGR